MGQREKGKSKLPNNIKKVSSDVEVRGVLVDGQNPDNSRTTYIETVIIDVPVCCHKDSTDAMETDGDSDNHHFEVRRFDYNGGQKSRRLDTVAPPRPVEVKKLDKNSTLVVYTIRKHELSFTEFIMSLRLILADHPDRADALHCHPDFLNLSSTGEHPMLARPFAEPCGARWIHVKLQLVGEDNKVECWTTLVMADYSLYVYGFENKDKQMYALKDDNDNDYCFFKQTYPDAHPLPLSTSYGSLLQSRVETLEGTFRARRFMEEAVRFLSSYNPKEDRKKRVGKTLAGLILMICESARMNPVLNVFARAWTMPEPTEVARSSAFKGLQSLFVLGFWGNGSKQLRRWDGEWLEDLWKLLQGIYLVKNKRGWNNERGWQGAFRTAGSGPDGPSGNPGGSGCSKQKEGGGGSGGGGTGEGGPSSGGSGSGKLEWGGGGGGGPGYFSWKTEKVTTTIDTPSDTSEYGNTTYSTRPDTRKRLASGGSGVSPSSSRRKLDHEPGRDDVSQSGGSSGGDGDDSPADDVEARSTVARGRPRVELLAIKPKSQDHEVLGTKIIVFDGKRGQIVYECKKEGGQVGKDKDLVLTGPYRGISAEYGCFTIRIDILNEPSSSRFEWACDDQIHANEVDNWTLSPKTISTPGGGGREVAEVTYVVMSNAQDATNIKLVFTGPVAGVYGEVTAYIGEFTKEGTFQRKLKKGSKLFDRTCATSQKRTGSRQALELDLARSVVAVPCNLELGIGLDLHIITETSNVAVPAKEFKMVTTLGFANRALTANYKDGQVEAIANVTWYPEIGRPIGGEGGVRDSKFTPETEQALRAAHELASEAGHEEVLPLDLAMVLARDKQGILRQAIAQVSGRDGAVKFKKVLAKKINKGKNPTLSNYKSLEDVIQLARSEQDKRWAGAPLQLGQLVLSLHSDPHISSCYTVVPKELVFQELEMRQELEMYGGHDLVAEARAGMLIAVVSRDEEIDSVANILSSHNKNNAILVGEPGVGKAAVVQGLALRIARGDCSGLQGARLIALDMASLADGDGEKLLRDVIDKVVQVQEAQGKQGVILFIKDIHSVLGINAPNLGMKQLLLRLCTDMGGRLRCIGSTTPENFSMEVAAFDQHFDKVDVPELSVEDTIFDILRVHKEKLECDHGVRISDRALVTAARLASRYDITAGRRLPDKAIALVDKACIMLSVQLESRLAGKVILEEKMTELQAELGSLGEVKKQQRQLERIRKYREWREQQLSELPESERRILPPSILKNGSPDEIVLALIQHELREIEKKENFLSFLAGKLMEEVNGEDKESKALWEKREKALDEMLGDLDRSKQAWKDFKESCESTKNFEDVILALTVGHQQIKEVVSQQAKIPVWVVGLHERVVGQTEAVDAVVDAIEQASMRAPSSHQPQKPMGSFLFVGPTGVGKTEFAKALAEQLFGNEKHFIRIDMSKYREEHSVSRLIGAPPSYKGGLLTNKVLSKPRSVVLLDKVEKADKKALNILLQVLDDGLLRDSKGNKVNFANTVIIMESNHGVEDRHDGESSVSMDKKQNVDMDEVKRCFGHPLLDRLSKIVIFDRLSDDELRKIAHRQINVLERDFVELELAVTLRATDAAVDSILDKIQREFKMNDAKRVGKWIQSKLKDKLDEVENCTVRINGLDGDNELVYEVVERSGENKDVNTDEDDYSSDEENDDDYSSNEENDTDIDEENDTDIKQVYDQSLGQLQSDTREKIKVEEKEKIKQEEKDLPQKSPELGSPSGNNKDDYVNHLKEWQRRHPTSMESMKSKAAKLSMIFFSWVDAY